MTCHAAREWLSDLLDEAIEADRRVEVDAHLAACADCRFELDRLRSTVGSLRALEHPRAPAGFVDRVVQRVHPVPWYRRLSAWLFLPLSVKLPAEAAAVVVIAGLAMLVWERTPEFQSAARQDDATTRVPSETPPPPAPAATSRPSKPPRERSDARPRSSVAPAESRVPQAPPEAKVADSPVPETKVVAPLTPEAKMESEVRAEPAPPALAPSQPLARPGPSATQSDRSEFRARTAPQTVRRTLGAVAASDQAGRLVVRDRDAAAVALVKLVSRIGGHEIGRRRDADDTVIDVQLPAARYDEFVRGLDALGSWTAAGRPNILPLEPPQIRLTIRLSG